MGLAITDCEKIVELVKENMAFNDDDSAELIEYDNPANDEK